MSASEPLVSVVIPTYNRAAAVVEAIESCLAQTLDDFEVVVVDDGSRDDTPRVLASRYGAEPRVRVVRTENRGCAAARNLGIDHARGRYVALLDSDDLLLPESLEARAAGLEAAPEADLLVCDVLFEVEGEVRDRLFAKRRWRRPVSLEAVAEGGYAMPSATLFRREVFDTLRYDPAQRFMEDTDLLVRYLEAGRRVVCLDRPLVRYRALAQDTAPRLTLQTDAMLEQHVRLFERLAPHARRRRRFAYRLARYRALLHMGRGQHREARPHLLRWLLWRPTSRQARRLLWRSFRAPAPGPGPSRS